MNILHVINIYFSLSYFGDQFKHFSEKGYKIHVICSPSEYLEEYAKRQHISYAEVPINRSISIIDDLKAIALVYKYIKVNHIDIVEGHTPKGALIGMIAAWLRRVPKRIYFRHGLVYETSKGIKRLILITCDKIVSRCSTEIVCVSPSVLKRSIEDNLAPGKNTIVLGKGSCGGVDTYNQFNPAHIDKIVVERLRDSLGISKNDFVIGFTGRLVRDKGIAELVRAFELLPDKEHAKLLLVGMFESRDALPDDIRDEILHTPNIIYTGFINGNMQNYYAIMDVYVLPSYREGFPTGVLEAQSMGIPVLTTKATGCIDSIVEGVTGFFISHDPKDIAKKIELIRNTNLIACNNCRKWAADNFDCNIIWDEIELLYNSLNNQIQ